MEIREAFGILGLDFKANEKEIKKRFRELALKHHPDRGGDTKEMAIMTEAYLTVIKNKRKKGLTPAEKALNIIEKQNEIIIAHYEKQKLVLKSENSISQIKNRFSNKYKQKKWLSGALGFFAAVLALIIKFLIPALSEAVLTGNVILYPFINIYTLTLLFASFVFGYFFLINNLELKWIEQAIEDIREKLDDKGTFLNIFGHITDGMLGRVNKFTKENIIEFLTYSENYNRKSLRSPILIFPYSIRLISLLRGPEYYCARFGTIRFVTLISRILGPENFVKILLAKGEELGILKSTESFDKGSFKVFYHLNVPS